MQSRKRHIRETLATLEEVEAAAVEDVICTGTCARAGIFYAGQDVQHTQQSQGK